MSYNFTCITSTPRLTKLYPQGVECDRVVELPPLSSSPHLDTALFMMETSGGSTLTPRQACGVESAARKVAVILITIYCKVVI